VIEKARTALDQSLTGGSTLDATLEAASVAVAARHGDTKLFDALAAASARAAAPDAHYRYLYALTQFADPALIDRALQRVLGPEMRSQDAAIYLARFFRNPAARDRAWAFVKQRWTELEPKVTIVGGDTSLVYALGAFCDARTRDDISSFFAAHKLPGATRTLGQTIERINNCVALREAQSGAVSTWLNSQKP